MRRRAALALCLLAGALCGGCVSNDIPQRPSASLPAIAAPPGATVLLDTSGSGGIDTVKTASFTAPAHWAITYAYSCAGHGAGTFWLQIKADSGPAVSSAGLLVDPQDDAPADSGTDYVDLPGGFHLEANELCPWHAIVAACHPDCGHEAAGGGVVELSGNGSYASRLLPVAAEMMLAFAYDCVDAPGGNPALSTSTFSIELPKPSRDFTTTLAEGGGTDGSGVSYLHFATPRDDQLLIHSDCPWHLRFGPKGSVQPFADVAPAPHVTAPPQPGGGRLLLHAEGTDEVYSDSFTAAGSVTLAYSYSCYRYVLDVGFSISVVPADGTSVVPVEAGLIQPTALSGRTSVVLPLDGSFSLQVGDIFGECPWSVSVYG